MALVVEDGTGVDQSPSANSYATVAEADSYFSARNNSDWSGATTAAKEAALIEATDWLGQQYRMRWKGIRVSSGQPLDWPRYGVILEDTYELDTVDYPSSSIGFPNELDSDFIPNELKYATMEMALRRIEDSATKLTADLDRGGGLKRLRRCPIH